MFRPYSFRSGFAVVLLGALSFAQAGCGEAEPAATSGDDVVQKVNGKSIEKPEQAFDVAESLRTAPVLLVDYLRDGKPRQLSIAITDER